MVPIHVHDLVRMAVYHKSDARLDPHSKAMSNNLKGMVEAEPVVKERDALRIDQPPTKGRP